MTRNISVRKDAFHHTNCSAGVNEVFIRLRKYFVANLCEGVRQ